MNDLVVLPDHRELACIVQQVQQNSISVEMATQAGAQAALNSNGEGQVVQGTNGYRVGFPPAGTATLLLFNRLQ